MTEFCEHRFVYSGMRYADGCTPRPGSGATTVHYGHAYHCERCLETRVEKISGLDQNSYQQRLPNSAPASDEEWRLLVPEHDRGMRRY